MVPWFATSVGSLSPTAKYANLHVVAVLPWLEITAIRGSLSHLDMTLSVFERLVDFYRHMLARLGYCSMDEVGEWAHT